MYFKVPLICNEYDANVYKKKKKKSFRKNVGVQILYPLIFNNHKS